MTPENTIQTKQDLFNLIINNYKQINSYGVLKIGVFGSFVNGIPTEKSDIDLFVEFDPAKKTLKNFVGLAQFIQDKSARKVEIITPQSLNKFIGKYIIEQVEYVPYTA